ncbi:hypothetical protein F2P81_014383 [Scophthalmus maximus]|uniref:cullin-RING-type E3 NEDD8 transferase n=1 Tax=Scophthalmus maximus TaxID=52904 RepID=A0A6A4SM93_SCOMX|nr:hypothetical protein F2P81_014383 [Scophthalmus maximus]
MFSSRCCRGGGGCLWVTLPLLLLLRWSGQLVAAELVAQVEVFLEQRPGVSALLQGDVVESSGGGRSSEDREELDGELVLVRDEETQVSGGKGEEDDDAAKEQEPWIGLVPVEMDDSKASTGNQESFADAMVNKMDLSQALSKPIIVIQTSENVTKLIGALLRGLQATAKITYKTILRDNLGATLTLWSSCGRSRGGRYGEWQGLICTGETNSQVQKYLQQLWDTVLLVALILSTGVIVQARWQNQDQQRNDDLELLPKQDVLKTMLSLKTKTYRQPKPWCDPSQPAETDNCAVCLEAFNNNQLVPSRLVSSSSQCLRVLPCLHEFHRECVDPWLLLQHTCPLCKRSILTMDRGSKRKNFSQQLPAPSEDRGAAGCRRRNTNTMKYCTARLDRREALLYGTCFQTPTRQRRFVLIIVNRLDDVTRTVGR